MIASGASALELKKRNTVSRSFTQVNGQNRTRFAVIDLTTGKNVTSAAVKGQSDQIVGGNAAAEGHSH